MVVAPARWVEDPVTGESLVAAEPVDTEPVDTELGAGQSRCEQCGAVLSHDDIFCGECGFVSHSIRQAFSGTVFTGETGKIDLKPLTPIADLPRSLPEPVSVALPAKPFVPEPPTTPETVTSSEPTALREPVIDKVPVISSVPLTAVPPRLSRSRFLDDDEDLEVTRIVNRSSGDRFVLQFSTGESFTVHGTGLIGRNPRPEPGEFFEHLVRVLDAGKSVSKTHLEFGQEAGMFWINDRFSGNGTVIREPDTNARRAEAGRRYRVARGTRVDIGEQFFVIS